MSFTNINDPDGIKALLEQLGASQVWQTTVNAAVPPASSSIGALTPEVAASVESTRVELSSPQSQPTPPQPGSRPAATGLGTKTSSTAPSVASLLSQLNASGWTRPTSTATSEDVLSLSSAGNAGPSRLSHPRSSSLDHQSFPPEPKQQQSQPLRSPNPPQPPITTTPEEDVRFISFQQALPHLSQLASNSKFIAAVGRLRGEQKELEQKLSEERCAIRRKHEEKVKVARTKANMTGAELSKHEVDMLNDAFRRDVQKFDAERVLIAWDALIEKQQIALETLGVPTIFRTGSTETLEVSGDSSSSGPDLRHGHNCRCLL
ncbi:hypothetical protein PISMIDRAFT_682151 [Pisolithus microcarpus 441]|uniref:Uncharacterized protein n=1 Tax=Pisolithus microcarpus 441 TaxID=765257 RepID=A0A0C9ZE53_9AGAM|nr:hypothetical protein PISMIDRAFT_682151 [Pisolithus microcarpus 441]